MAPKVKSYPDCKPSSVEWLGDIPAHWEVRRLRNVADMRVSNVDKHIREGEIPVRLCNYVDVYKNERINGQMDFMQATATAEEIKRFQLEAGDVLITKDSETWDDIGVPALITESAPNLISGYHLALLRPRVDELVSDYLLRALQSKCLAYQFHIEAKGVTRYGLSHAGIKSVRVPLPPLAEQTAIVRYLDHADGCIRRYINAKERLIELLKEQRQVVIHRAVTRGLNPDVRLKPSGVEWLGDIPTHWEVLPGRICFYEKQISNAGMIEHRVLSLSYGHIVVKPTEKLRGLVPASFETYQVINPGDIVCRPTDLQNDRTSLRFGIAKDRGIITSAYMCLNTKGRLDNRYGHLILHTYDLNKVFYGLGSGLRQNLSWEDFKYLPCLIPPLPEQATIVEYLDKVTTDIDNTIGRTRRQIELLNEYRTRLIADVVTGKLDVREAAARLPVKSDKPSKIAEEIKVIED